MAAAAIEHLAFLEQVVVVEIGRMPAAGAEAEVEATFEHRALDLRRRCDLHRDLHFRRARIEAGDCIMQPAGRIVDQVVDDADGEVADQAARARRQLRTGTPRWRRTGAGWPDRSACPFSVRLKPDRPRSHRRRPSRCSSAVICVLMVDWLTLSSICAAEKPPASTTFANTRSNRRSPSLRLASMLSPHQRQPPGSILMFALADGKALSRRLLKSARRKRS